MEDYIEKESSDVAQSTHDTEEKTKAPPRPPATHTQRDKATLLLVVQLLERKRKRGKPEGREETF